MDTADHIRITERVCKSLGIDCRRIIEAVRVAPEMKNFKPDVIWACVVEARKKKIEGKDYWNDLGLALRWIQDCCGKVGRFVSRPNRPIRDPVKLRELVLNVKPQSDEMSASGLAVFLTASIIQCVLDPEIKNRAPHHVAVLALPFILTVLNPYAVLIAPMLSYILHKMDIAGYLTYKSFVR